MSLPSKKVIQIDNNTIAYEYRMLNHDMQLVYHEDKCVECGFCHRVCPVTVSIYNEPLKKTAIGTPAEMGIESDKKIVVDLSKCIWCGTCDIFCPSKALELIINGERKLNLIENGSIPEFDVEPRTLADGKEVSKIVQGNILIECEETNIKKIDAFTKECATGALSRKNKSIEIDDNLCILCYKCTEAAKNYDNISVKVFRDRFKNVKGEPGSVWNGIMLRVLGKEGKMKGIMSRSQNKLADAVMRLMGKETLED